MKTNNLEKNCNLIPQQTIDFEQSNSVNTNNESKIDSINTFKQDENHSNIESSKNEQTNIQEITDSVQESSTSIQDKNLIQKIKSREAGKKFREKLNKEKNFFENEALAISDLNDSLVKSLLAFNSNSLNFDETNSDIQNKIAKSFENIVKETIYKTLNSNNSDVKQKNLQLKIENQVLKDLLKK